MHLDSLGLLRRWHGHQGRGGPSSCSTSGLWVSAIGPIAALLLWLHLFTAGLPLAGMQVSVHE